jgi:predicted DNA-binding transcriptional regulator AlpA
MANMDDNLLSSKEVLAYLKIHRQTLWRLEKSGAVQPVKIGTVKRYKASEIQGKRKIK